MFTSRPLLHREEKREEVSYSEDVALGLYSTLSDG